MRGRLTPIDQALPDPPSRPPGPGQAFARVDRQRLVALARSMPDCQSAVLACLVWQAARQERLHRGRHAGQFVARLSGAQLAEMTHRPLRTVRHGLARLTRAGIIRREGAAPGRTAVYALNLAPG
jgi:hypothetical protein